MKNLPPLSYLSLYTSLLLENEEHVSNRQDPGEASHAKLIQSPSYLRTSATREAHKVLVIGDSLLRGTKASICHPDNFIETVPEISLEKFGAYQKLIFMTLLTGCQVW